MATVKPFAALRPDPALAARICELPYDVLSSAEARAAAAGNPLSFFHVSKPEIDLALETDPAAPEVYATGAQRFASMIKAGMLQQDRRPAFYLYRQIMGEHSQLGVVAVASCEDYLGDRVRKHELTRPEKEDDRARHIEHLNAQTGPAFLLYRPDAVLRESLESQAAGPPDVDFSATDGVRHTAWTVRELAAERLIEARFASMPSLYIADGHHRTAAAARVYQKRKGAGASGFFLSVLFSQDDVQVLPYHRVLRDLNGSTPGEVLESLARVCVIQKAGARQPSKRHQAGFLLEGTWHLLEFRPEFADVDDPLEQLDAALLQKHILAPVFGIENPRTSQRIQFVGGIRGTPELERLVASGEFACAFSLFPTSVAELIAVADAGQIMPPKSTWFEPKLRDGMFCHLLGEPKLNPRV
ncbi:MAG: DUF1015 domain-containing protein [Verrucomicrobiia bacterium]